MRSGNGSMEDHRNRVREVEMRLLAENQKKAKEALVIEERKKQKEEEERAKQIREQEQRQQALRMWKQLLKK